MSVKFVFEGVKFVLQHNCFLQLRVNRDVLDWSQLISPESTQMNMNGCVHMQLFSHLRMKITTSSIIFGNSLIVLCSWSDIGTSSSLSSWPASTWMLIARFFIASCNSFSVFTCCQNNQSSYWCWKQKRSQLCIRPRYKRIWHVWRDSATSSQTAYRNNSQQSITLLIAVPRLTNIPASFAEAEQCRADCNSSNSTASFLIRGSTAFGSMLRLYNCIWRGNHSSEKDFVPRWPATAVIRGLDYQISPRILLKFCEQIRSDQRQDSLTICPCSTRQVFP